MPHLPDFYRRYPDIYLMIGVSDREVDLIQEGVDCVIRMGELNNSSGGRPLGRFRFNCASTGLSQGIWRAVVTGGALSAPGGAYFSGQARRADEFRFVRHGETFSVRQRQRRGDERALYKNVPGGLRAGAAGEISLLTTCRRRLVEVLTDWQPPRYPSHCSIRTSAFSPAVRAFAEWMSEVV
jgi:LysR family transcriptional regulator for bpeEF and oprC